MRSVNPITILVAALLFPSAHALGQWEVRAYGGAGLSRLNTQMHLAQGRDEAQTVQYRFSWLLGATAAHPITDKLTFGSGLCWSAFNGHNELRIRGNLTQEQQWELQYVYLPLMINFRWQGVHVGAGYQFGVPVANTIAFTDHNAWMGMADSRSSTHRLDLLRTDMGVVAEAGYAFGGKVGAGIRYYRGLCDIKDHSDGMMDPYYTEQFAVVLSYCFLRQANTQPQAPVPEGPEQQ
ncbi:MAG: PorT family protein [Bacteroidetes bacterium]|nr:PorT family protein [Bacteroidota bacterium]